MIQNRELPVKIFGARSMRLPLTRFTVLRLMLAIAVIASLLGAERLWQRSACYKKQAALCAFFELQMLYYSAQIENDSSWDSIDDKSECVMLNRVEANHYGNLKVIYRRVAMYPWESLPLDVPDSVNPWDLGSLSASEIEDMVKAGFAE